jgi:hypothetical protein
MELTARTGSETRHAVFYYNIFIFLIELIYIKEVEPFQAIKRPSLIYPIDPLPKS